MVVILLSIEIADGDDPSSVGIDSERKRQSFTAAIELLNAVGDLGIWTVIGVVGLNSNDAVTDGYVFNDRFLECGAVEAWSVVIDVLNVHEQLGRIGSTRIAAIFNR